MTKKAAKAPKKTTPPTKKWKMVERTGPSERHNGIGDRLVAAAKEMNDALQGAYGFTETRVEIGMSAMTEDGPAQLLVKVWNLTHPADLTFAYKVTLAEEVHTVVEKSA